MSHPDPSHHSTAHAQNTPHLNRSMQTRHLVMLSLGGAIGTGLFLNSGSVIQQTGSVGAILAYLLGGLIAYLVMLCLGELAVHVPDSGAFSTYATKFINPATGYMIAWLYWLTWTATLGTEFTAAGILMQHWFPDVSVWIWCIVFGVLIFASNVFSAKAFAETEFWLAIVKVATVLIFIILGSIAIFGFTSGFQPAPMLHNITAQGWFPNGLMPILMTMLAVNFAFSGMELIGVAAGETDNPSKNIPKAINAALLRLVIFFVGTIFIIATLIPYQQLGLSQSPFVMVFERIGIPYTADIMNFVIITALLSTANSGLYAASRMIWSLSNQKMLPKTFGKLSQHGIPINALLFSMIGGVASLFTSVYAADVVYTLLLSIASFTMVVVWMSIALSHYRFRRQFLQQGGTLDQLTYKAPFYPVVPIAAFILCFITCIGMAFDPTLIWGFVGCLLFIAGCYASYYLWYQPKIGIK
jgi:S-methylmethionine transporter